MRSSSGGGVITRHGSRLGAALEWSTSPDISDVDDDGAILDAEVDEMLWGADSDCCCSGSWAVCPGMAWEES